MDYLEELKECGSYEAWKRMDRERKRDKVEGFIRRVRSCRTFDGLELVADEARAAGLWDAENGLLKQTIGDFNARFRGRITPAKWTDGNDTFVVVDDRVVSRRWIRTRTLSANGFRYAGQVKMKVKQ